MIERYTRKEIKNIWEDKNKYLIWLEIELAAAEGLQLDKAEVSELIKAIDNEEEFDDVELDAVGLAAVAGGGAKRRWC